ncbi:MAG: hypothetical protein IJ105_04820 [Bacilli bacterium]|nr:hypothetical protein [Bacilli bacterium]
MMLDNIFYMYSQMDNSSQILLFLIILVALMLVSIFIINHITKKRNEKYDKMFNPIDRYTKTMNKQIKNNKEDSIKNIVVEKKKQKQEKFIEAVNEDIEVMEDPEIIEVVSDNNSIDKIANLLEDNINNPKPIDLTKFEEEEEKNAIISYDELVRKAGAKKIIYKTEKATINEEVKEDKIEIKSDNSKKFKASQVISPIYGIKKQNQEKKEIDEFIDLEDIPVNENKYTDEDLQKDITFLTSLKTFRSNLD